MLKIGPIPPLEENGHSESLGVFRVNSFIKAMEDFIRGKPDLSAEQKGELINRMDLEKVTHLQ